MFPFNKFIVNRYLSPASSLINDYSIPVMTGCFLSSAPSAGSINPVHQGASQGIRIQVMTSLRTAACDID